MATDHPDPKTADLPVRRPLPAHPPTGIALPRRWRRQRVIPLAIVVALTAGAGGALWDRMTDHGAPAVWTASGTTDPDSAPSLGGWLTSDAVVRPRVGGLIAYDRADGHQRWAFQPDGDRRSVCGISPDVVAGIGIVVLGDGARLCDQVVAIDTAGGVVKWRASAPDAWFTGDEPSDLAPAVFGDVVAVMERHGIAAYRRDDGTPVWTYSSPAGCYPDALDGAGDRVIGTLQCPDVAGDAVGKAVGLDARTGAEVWHTDLSGPGAYDTRVLSADPPVISLGQKSVADVHEIRSFDRSGTLRAVIPTRGLEAAEDDDMDPVSGTRVLGNLLIAVTEDSNDGPNMDLPSVRILAFDLGTGRRVWEADPDPGADYWLAKTTDGTITVVDQRTPILFAGHVRLLRLSPSNGKAVVVGDSSHGVLDDLVDPVFLADGSGVFGVDPVISSPVNPTAVVRIR